MKIILIDRNTKWKKIYSKVRKSLQYEFKSEILCNILNIQLATTCYEFKNCAFVSPANSYGYMDGGIDAVYSKMFPGIEQKVRNKIREVSPYKKKQQHVLPVGSATLVNINDTTHLICAPTMFLPENVAQSENAYYSTLAALLVVQKYNQSAKEQIDTIFIPGMCSGCGHMTLTQSLKQMLRAIQDFETTTFDDQSSDSSTYLSNETVLLKCYMPAWKSISADIKENNTC